MMPSLSPKPQHLARRTPQYDWIFRTHTVAPIAIATTLLLFYIWKSVFPASTAHNASPEHRSGCEKYPEDCQNTAPFIFDSLHSLLKQWPSSYGSNGHSVVPVRLPRDIPLYHAKQWRGVPRKPTWFSFDPEMGLGIYAATGITYLHTFVTTKDLKLLYFDGQSAVLSAYGTLDSQTALLREHVVLDPGNEFVYNETARGQELCAYAQEIHVDGIMRMDAGFETLICDFEASGLKESHAANVTVPGKGSAREDDPNLPQDPTRPPPHGIGNMYALNNGWEWVRSGTWHYGGYGQVGGSHSESRVDLDLCGMVTFYSPHLRSLIGKHHADLNGTQGFQSGWGLRRGHRLLDITVDDSKMVKAWVREAITPHRLPHTWNYSPSTSIRNDTPCSGINWQALTETITDQHKGRILEIANAVAKFQQGAMPLEKLLDYIHGLSHAALHPFVQYPTEQASSLQEIRDMTLERCSRLYTKHIPAKSYNHFEALLKDSIEILLARICSWEWEAFEWSERHTTDLLRHGQVHSKKSAMTEGDRGGLIDEVKTFAESTEAFIKWIGWDLWTQCEDKCAWDELCYIPMWPVVYAPGMHQGGPYGGSHLTAEEQREFWRPKCINREKFDSGGGRGRDPDHQLPDVPGNGL